MADAETFRAGIERIWGKHGAQTAAANAFEVSSRSIRYWVAGERPVPAGVMAELRAMLDMAPPPNTTDEDDRDDACADAIEPELSALWVRAQRAGWSEAEILVAIMSHIVTGLKSRAGVEPTRELLQQAIDGL